MPNSREQLVEIQKDLLEDLKARIYDTYGRRDAEMDRYYRDYQAEFRQGYQRHASQAELAGTLVRADIAYFGDYHTFRPAQSSVLRLLEKAAVERGRKVVLALECLHAAHKHYARDMIDLKLEESEFLEAVRWDHTWGFSWASFSRFFKFARDHRAPLFGININADDRREDLKYRDEFAGYLIAALSLLYPECLVAVVYGDLHLARGHIPAAVDRHLARFGATRKSVRIYQNSETIYWRLAESRLENVVDAVKVDRDVYCIMEATPLVKFQSFANWQHHRAELVFGDDLTVEGAVHEQVVELIGTICDFLGLAPPDVGKFELYTPADLDLLERLVERGLYTRDEMEALRAYVEMADSAYFTRAGILYVGNFSVSNAAEAAARFILAEYGTNEEEAVESKDEFYGRVIVEALAYFCTKIIDPRRKPSTEVEFADVDRRSARKRKLATGLSRDLKIARAWLKHRQYERRMSTGEGTPAPSSLYRLPTDVHIGVTRALGRSLGERMFNGMASEQLDKAVVREAMIEDPFAPGVSRKRYFDLVKLLGEDGRGDRI